MEDIRQDTFGNLPTYQPDMDQLAKDALVAFEAGEWDDGYALAMKTDCTNAGIQYCLGECYECGLGVERDVREAAAWYRKAAEQGHAHAQYELGLCYVNGQGMEKDEREAEAWYRRAAAKGNANAQEALRWRNLSW